MYVFQFASDLRRFLSAQAISQQPVGFVPTMGALHDGHLQLVRQAQAEGYLCVCSIFVNPTQFNDPEDLRKYPRMPVSDIAILAKAGCNALFMPPVEEVYPSGTTPGLPFDFGALEQVMEGAFRPGHFQGVAQVVSRLLDLVQPRRLYMGQKDFQQTAIIREMLRQQGSSVELCIAETVRETDGLAMSSRNQRLTPEFRRAAPAIYKALLETRRLFPEMPIPDICRHATQILSEAGLRPEYFEIVNGRTLLPLDNPLRADYVVACTAAWAGDVRLIDNLVLRSPSQEGAL